MTRICRSIRRFSNVFHHMDHGPSCLATKKWGKKIVCCFINVPNINQSMCSLCRSWRPSIILVQMQPWSCLRTVCRQNVSCGRTSLAAQLHNQSSVDVTYRIAVCLHGCVFYHDNKPSFVAAAAALSGGLLYCRPLSVRSAQCLTPAVAFVRRQFLPSGKSNSRAE